MTKRVLEYQCEAYNNTPEDAADQFARSFPETREVDKISWQVSRFRLVDGTNTYEVVFIPAVRFERVAVWQVWRVEQ